MIGSLRVNQLVAVALGVFSVGYLAVAFQIPEFAVGVTVQPGSFPKVLGVLMLALSVLLFWQRPAAPDPAGGVAVPADPASETPAPPDRAPPAQDPSAQRTISRLGSTRWDVPVVLSSMVAYVVLLRPLGFLLVTAVHLAAMTWYLGYRRHVTNVVTAVAVATGLYLIVGYGFGINMPSGPLPL
jgi:putative tricarboxylic transport membrane protein